MAADNKYLDYEGLQSYHSKLVDKLKDLKYDPKRMFTSLDDLVKKSNWKDNLNNIGYVYGIPRGLMVTVDKELWQLNDPATFNTAVNTIGTPTIGKTPKDYGWVSISNEGITIDTYTGLTSVQDSYQGMIVYVKQDEYRGLYLLNSDDPTTITNWIKISTVDFNVSGHMLNLIK